MSNLANVAALLLTMIGAGIVVAAWIGFMAGIAINVARWFL